MDTTLKEDLETISRSVKEIAHIIKSKDLKIKVNGVELNPEKLRKEAELFEKFYQQRKEAADKLTGKSSEDEKK